MLEILCVVGDSAGGPIYQLYSCTDPICSFYTRSRVIFNSSIKKILKKIHLPFLIFFSDEKEDIYFYWPKPFILIEDMNLHLSTFRDNSGLKLQWGMLIEFPSNVMIFLQAICYTIICICISCIYIKELTGL